MPALAEPYADRLAALAPKASHLVHMPSHTYYWVGRYEDAAKANMRAVELGIDNAKRLGLPPPDGVWGLPYHSHNVTFGLGGALEAGDADIALKLGRPLVARSQAKTEAAPFSQMIAANGYYAIGALCRPGGSACAAQAEAALPRGGVALCARRGLGPRRQCWAESARKRRRSTGSAATSTRTTDRSRRRP